MPASVHLGQPGVDGSGIEVVGVDAAVAPGADHYRGPFDVEGGQVRRGLDDLGVGPEEVVPLEPDIDDIVLRRYPVRSRGSVAASACQLGRSGPARPKARVNPPMRATTAAALRARGMTTVSPYLTVSSAEAADLRLVVHGL